MLSLIGLPGVGKTSAGRLIARRFCVPFVDSDAVIEQRLGMSIAAFFAGSGEAAFRDVEEQVLCELLQPSAPPCVLATGGGAVLRGANRQALRARSTVFYLHGSPDELGRRLRNDSRRPLLQGVNAQHKLRQLYQQRDALYRETAHYVLETGHHGSLRVLVQRVCMQADMAGAFAAPPLSSPNLCAPHPCKPSSLPNA